MTAIHVAETSAVSTATAAAERACECLSFRLGAVEYGIDILKVQEIRGYEAPTRLANTPDFIKGIVNLRGVIVPIIDLRLKFGLEQAEYGPLTVTVILNVARSVVGVVVDAVSDVVDLLPGQIRPAPDFNHTVGANFITGIGSLDQADGQRMLVLLDIEGLMHSEDIGLAVKAA